MANSSEDGAGVTSQPESKLESFTPNWSDRKAAEHEWVAGVVCARILNNEMPPADAYNWARILYHEVDP